MDGERRIHNGMFVHRPALIARFSPCPSPLSGRVLEHFHGAATHPGVGETTFPQRHESYNRLVVLQWLDREDGPENVAWARTSCDALRPHVARESYANDQTGDDAEGALEDRLDPTNFLHLNHNVGPTGQGAEGGSPAHGR